MARYGSPWSSGWGSPEMHCAYVLPDFAGMAASGNTYLPLSFLASPGLDSNIPYYGIYRNAQWLKNIPIIAGQPAKAIVDIPWGSQSLSILPLRHGHMDGGYATEKVARVFEGVDNARITLPFTFNPAIFVPPLSDGGYTSNWNLTGLVQGQNTAYVSSHPSWGRLGLALVVAAGVVTVNITSYGRLVSSGSAAILGAPFPVTLVDQTTNGTGISGTVTISNTVASVAGGTMDARWPVSMQILRDTFDPPTTVRATVNFKGINSVRWTEPTDLNGTYYYRTQPISDTGITGTQSGSVSVSTIAPPIAPTTLAYASGAAANTVLSFVQPGPIGSTYRLYGPLNPATGNLEVGRLVNVNDIAATAGSGATTINCPPITGYPGIIYMVLRAVFGGIQERNLNMIALEFDASGNYVPPRPNMPGIDQASIVITAGRTVAVKGLYNTDHQLAVPTGLRLFVRANGAAYTTDANGNLNGNVGAGGALSASAVKGVLQGTVTYTFPADGYYYMTMLAATAGGVQSPSVGYNEVLIIVSNAQLPAATVSPAQLSRS